MVRILTHPPTLLSTQIHSIWVTCRRTSGSWSINLLVVQPQYGIHSPEKYSNPWTNINFNQAFTTTIKSVQCPSTQDIWNRTHTSMDNVLSKKHSTLINFCISLHHPSLCNTHEFLCLVPKKKLLPPIIHSSPAELFTKCMPSLALYFFCIIDITVDEICLIFLQILSLPTHRSRWWFEVWWVRRVVEGIPWQVKQHKEAGVIVIVSVTSALQERPAVQLDDFVVLYCPLKLSLLSGLSHSPILCPFRPQNHVNFFSVWSFVIFYYPTVNC